MPVTARDMPQDARNSRQAADRTFTTEYLQACITLKNERYNFIMPINDNWLTVQEAAKESGYHPERIRELIREDKIKARKISILWLVDRKSLLAYLKKAQTLGEKRGRKPKK